MTILNHRTVVVEYHLQNQRDFIFTISELSTIELEELSQESSAVREFAVTNYRGRKWHRLKVPII